MISCDSPLQRLVTLQPKKKIQRVKFGSHLPNDFPLDQANEIEPAVQNLDGAHHYVACRKSGNSAENRLRGACERAAIAFALKNRLRVGSKAEIIRLRRFQASSADRDRAFKLDCIAEIKAPGLFNRRRFHEEAVMWLMVDQAVAIKPLQRRPRWGEADPDVV